MRVAGGYQWIDFDQFMLAPEIGFASALKHLQVGEPESAARTILAGPTLHQYAKAPSNPFNAETRNRLLQRSEEQHRSEIHKGLAWLDRMAAEFSDVKKLIEGAVRRPDCADQAKS